ncbi:unnamed protein product [Dovyalis caffra]|uniref:Bifunctional inhibitor/plant lipid transfer protein/seed storage helical domain-containing protein n=1 Tax=Dovyalis caffra TaxID=77055 RepID=A0AAV1SB64_9ROSI|nr:unnamed protein product [Dovyalis caffra]
MGRVKILALALFVASLLLEQPATEANPAPTQHPLCVSQYSLVNYACSGIRGTPLPNYSLTSDDDHDGGHGHGHGHSHRHGHRHRHRASHHGPSSSQDNCCKWLNELDDECVCDLLYNLPPFLSKPAHQYTLYVDEACNVTYNLFLFLVFDVNGQLQNPIPQRPLCVSQLALVNYACGNLLPTPPATTTTSLPSTVVFPGDDDNNRGHRHRHGHGHVMTEARS